MARHGDGCRQVFDNNEYKIKNSNTMDIWMARHGDGCRQVLDNNEVKIKNANTMNGWMARHGDGCQKGWYEDTSITDMILTKDKQSKLNKYRIVSKEKQSIKR